MLALLSILSAPSLKEIQLALFELQLQVCLIQDGHQAAILNIKNLFDVHKPQTIRDRGVKFQTIWPIHFWEITLHGSTYGRTDGHIITRPNYNTDVL